ncbi:hypothetical protein ES703_16805 [subsurface metagenome]
MSRVMKQAVFPPGWRINCPKHNRSTVGGNFIMSPITPGTNKQKPHPTRRLIPPMAGMTDQVGLQRLPNRTGSWCLLKQHQLDGSGELRRYHPSDIQSGRQFTPTVVTAVPDDLVIPRLTATISQLHQLPAQ